METGVVALLHTIDTFVRCPAGMICDKNAYYGSDIKNYALEKSYIVDAETFLMLTEQGRDKINRWNLDFSSLNRSSACEVFDEFEFVDRKFKEILWNWQHYKKNSEDFRELNFQIIRSVELCNEVYLKKLVDLDNVLNAFYFRLLHASANVTKGHDKYMASPMVDSVHSIWFELHQLLYDTSGHARNSE